MKAGDVSIFLDTVRDARRYKAVSLKGENKARLWSNVKWCRVLNVGTSVSVRVWLEGVVCKAALPGDDPAMSAG